MFWNKKEEKRGLPDLPPIQSPFNKDLVPSSLPQEREEFAEDENAQDLPSFPDSPLNKGFSQSAIKDAVSGDEESEPVGQNFNDRTFKTVEMEDAPESNRRSFSLPDLPSASSSPSLTSLAEQSDEDMDRREVTHENEEELRPSIKSSVSSESSYSSYSPSPSLAPPPVRRSKSIDRTLKASKVREEEPEEARESPSFPKMRLTKENVFVRIDKFNTARRALSAAQEQLDQVDSLLRRIREIKMREEQELAGWEKDLTTLKSRIQNVAENIFEKNEE